MNEEARFFVLKKFTREKELKETETYLDKHQSVEKLFTTLIFMDELNKHERTKPSTNNRPTQSPRSCERSVEQPDQRGNQPTPGIGQQITEFASQHPGTTLSIGAIGGAALAVLAVLSLKKQS